MIRTIQVVKNSDRVHVSINGIPHATYLFDSYQSQEIAIAWAGYSAYKLAAELQEDGFEINILPITTM